MRLAFVEFADFCSVVLCIAMICKKFIKARLRARFIYVKINMYILSQIFYTKQEKQRALSMLLAMVLCIGCVTMLATTVLAADADSLDDHLVLYSSFDGSNANDESGNGHHGTAVGNALI